MTDEEYYKAANLVISNKDPAKFIEIVNKMDNVNFVGYIKLYPNGPIVRGLPLLHAAITLSNFDCIEALLAKGANPNAIDMFNRTTLDHVIDKGQIDSGQIKIFMHLDAEGAKLFDTFQHSFYWGGSNLHAVAVRNDLANLAEALLKSGRYTANQTNPCDHTPLHTAVVFGSPKVIEVLLWYGADPKRPDNNGVTPLELVPSLGAHPNYQAVYHLLQDWLNASIQQPVPASYASYRGGFHQSSKPKAPTNVKLQDPDLSCDDLARSLSS